MFDCDSPLIRSSELNGAYLETFAMILQVEHVLTAMTVCGVLIVFCRSFIADENLIWWPEFLMNRIIAQIHYAPDTWRDRAHTGNFIIL